MSNVKQEWGLVDGEPHYVYEYADLEPKDRPIGKCLECGSDVLFKIGKVISSYVAHKQLNGACMAAQGEGAEHYNAKLRLASILRQTNSIKVLRTCSWCGVLNGSEPRIFSFDRVKLEYLHERTKPIDRIFPDITLDQVSIAFRRVCSKVGIVDFRLHDLRHTAASWLRMQGADIHTVAQLLGHKDLRMAARYQHLSPTFLAEAVGKLDAVFGDIGHQSVTTPIALPATMSASN
jgi:hypothetical protein